VAPIRMILAGFLGIGLALVVLTIGPSVAGAQTVCYTGCTGTVPPAVLATQNSQEPQVLASTAATSSGLAFTGADEAGLVALALVAVAGGGVLVGVSRRRRTNS
jgi:hypothetical protein